MVLTSKERSAIWRQKLRKNPVFYEEYKRKEGGRTEQKEK